MEWRGPWSNIMAIDVNDDGRDDQVAQLDVTWWVAVSDGSRLANQKMGTWAAAEVMRGNVHGEGK